MNSVSAQTLRRLHGWLTISWTAAGAVASVYSFMNPDSQWLLVILVFVSFYANAAGHWAAWEAARGEEKQDANASD